MIRIQKVCLIGAGRMGRQIGLCCAINGYDTVLFDAKKEIFEDVAAWEKTYLDGRIAKKRMTPEQVEEIKARYHFSDSLEEACRGADIVIEAVFEDENVKRGLFREMREFVSPDTIIATNSSFMVSSTFRDDVRYPERLCNMHFYNPPLVMKFVEVVKGPHTSEETAQSAMAFLKSMGKCPVLQTKELAGFCGNYFLKNLDCSKYFVQDGCGTYQESDIVQEHIIKRKMGNFHQIDLTGIDLSYTMLENSYKKKGVKPLLYDLTKEMYDAGRYGQKTGHGFYDYKEPYTVKAFRDRSGADPSAKKLGSVLTVGGERAEALARELSEEGVKAFYAPENADPAAYPQADMILEDLALPLEEKQAFYEKLSRLVPADTVLATNSYDILSSKLTEVTAHPERLLSAHFSSAGDGKVVEMAMNACTDQAVAGAVYDLCLAAGKLPVWQQWEIPEYGFLSKQYMSQMKEIVKFLVSGGYCTEEDIDICMTTGLGYVYGYSELKKTVF